MIALPYLGELAALGTALCWAFSSLFFAAGGRRVGSVVVNRARLVAAVVILGTAHLVLLGSLFPHDASPQRLLWLALSAIIGLVLGDSLLFQAYVMIGPRLGMLLYSLYPISGALLAGLLLGEVLRPMDVAGMALALSGAIWVVFERAGHDDSRPQRQGQALGALLALGGGVCQALGLVIAKQGLSGNFSALSAMVVRLWSAMAFMWLLTAVQGQAGRTVSALHHDRRAELLILAGALAGPSLGAWLSLVAVQAVQVGIASTLMAMSPVLLLPLVHWIYHEAITPRAMAGTALAVAGIGLMFLHA
jgi:drug/metabolite transporter (DMT)-like permease